MARKKKKLSRITDLVTFNQEIFQQKNTEHSIV